MIQEVRRVQAELELPRLAELEILKYSQIGIEEGRSIDGRKNARAILPDGSREGEATRVDELVLSQVRRGIAGQNRVQLDVARAQQGHVADIECGARNLRAVEIHPEVVASAESREVRSAL